MTNVARTGQTLLIAASSMLFAAFTSAMVVRRGIGGDWVAPALPAWIWATMGLAVAASFLVLRGQLRLAMVCGAGLVAGQLALLAQLRMGAIGEAFLSVLVAAHAAHAAAGLWALGRFGTRAEMFWHFVGAVWLYVLFLFGVWA